MLDARIHPLRSQFTLCVAAIASALAVGAATSAYASGGYSITENFAGGNSSQSGFYPPDTDGSVGGGYVTEFINGYVGVYSTAGAIQKNESLSTFWSNAGVTVASGFSPGDVRIIYDTSINRWVASSDTFVNSGSETANNQILLAVSATSSPLGSWRGVSVNSSPNNSSLWADFPTLGVNGDGVFVSANMFSTSTGSSSNIDVISLPLSSLESGSTSGLNLQQVSANNHGFAVQPINNFSTNTSNSTPENMYSNYASNGSTDSVARTQITGSITSPTLSSTQQLATTTGYSGPVSAPQTGSTITVDANDNRFSGSLYQQPANSTSANTVWEVITVQNPNHSALDALQWMRIDPVNNTVVASGLLSSSTLSLYDGSIAVTADGHIVVGLSASSSTTDPGAYAYIGTYDANTGTTSFTNLVQLIGGTAPVTAGGSSTTPARFGDYSTTVLDPNNPDAVWTFNEFGGGNKLWNTQISQITFTPEPATLAMLAVGGIGLLTARRRR